ncbi:hypothetical protein [Streptomyces sp. NPDC002205]
MTEPKRALERITEILGITKRFDEIDQDIPRDHRRTCPPSRPP